ncbi:DUF4118 domain-containing protein [Caulobacter segnis]|uniref:sensor histidine kinase n=1 Tax=Caulobacter segnis TaxID=88688 RepID=UPI00286671A1|nr:DUF4118 domain-containing protein [Caulobacter segnis]MDR6627924.1 two-component system sensor histidine kinase KdpD [Caulobacter segnis]
MMVSISPADGKSASVVQDLCAESMTPQAASDFRRFGPITQISGTVLLILLALLFSAILFSLFGTTRLSMVFLGAVLLAALAFGARSGLFGAILAFACYNFTLTEPRFTFEFAGPEDVLTLALFLVVALTTGGLAGRVRESERIERERADQLAALLEASQAQTATDEPEQILADLQQRLATVTCGPVVVCLPGGDRPSEEMDDVAWRGLIDSESGPATTRRSGPWRARRLGSSPDAPVAAWRSADPADPRTEALCKVLVDLAAVSLERARLSQIRSRTEADRQAAALRDAVLASLSHDLRTPLASILASSTSLRDYDDRFDPATRQGLVADIIGETDRLNRYVGNLLNLTRIQAGALRPTVSPVNLADLLDQAAHRAGRPTLGIAGSAGKTVMVEADPLLLEQVLFNVIDNALTHAGADAHIDVDVATDGRQVDLSIIDNGPGVPLEDTARIFETFMQARPTDGRRGAGIGLSVARGFMKAMGGGISAGPREDGASGLVVTLRLKGSVADA